MSLLSLFAYKLHLFEYLYKEILKITGSERLSFLGVDFEVLLRLGRFSPPGATKTVVGIYSLVVIEVQVLELFLICMNHF